MKQFQIVLLAVLCSASGGIAWSMPHSSVNDSVYYLLYTQSHKDGFLHIDVTDDSSLSKTDFNPNNPTKILVHGCKDSFESPFAQLVKDAYLESADVNVILFDWSYASGNPYAMSRLMVSELGEKVLKVISYLLKKGVSADTFHLIGHGLGAHIVGVTGQLASSELATIIPRVTGLDPPAALFTALNKDRLDTSSGAYVDVIHTTSNIYGYYDQLGHIDFYPNGGNLPQPGCGVDLSGSCSNARSFEYFAESITTSGGFQGVVCQDWQAYGEGACRPPPYVEMGENVPKGNVGKYFLHTSSVSPYGRGQAYP